MEEKWREWLKKINLEKTSYWIHEDKIYENTITLSPYNLFSINKTFYIFMSTSGETYYFKSPKWNWFFDENNKPIEKTFFIISNSKYKEGYKLKSTPTRRKALEINDEDLTNKLKNWIEHIKNENLEQTLGEIKYELGTVIDYSPYHFKKVQENKLFLRTYENKNLYINIYFNKDFNKHLKKQLKQGTNNHFYLVPLKTRPNTYRLINEQYYNIKFKNDLINYEKSPSLIKNHELKNKHTNNIWGVEQNSIFDEVLLDQYQKEAFDCSLKNPFSIINGYAGTGKSVVVKMISNFLVKEGWIVSRLSPTGRAAQLINGKTIHKWLEPIIGEKRKGKFEILGFAKKEFKEKECLIIDEASMIDSNLWNEIKRVWQGSSHIETKKIILVGDEGQLEPVEEGTPFLDYLKNPKMVKSNLKILHRNKENQDLSLFVENFRKTGHLNLNIVSPSIQFVNEKEALQKVADDKIQMIMPRRRGIIGSLEINKKIKSLMKLENQEPVFYTKVFQQSEINGKYWEIVDDSPVHINDKVIIVQNMWEWNITNGTTGIFLGKQRVRLYNHSSNKHSTLRNCYKFKNPESNRIFYLPANQDTKTKIELAYAITIHKSQGSEYNKLILFLKNVYVDKKMLYTGITRAKKKIYIVV